MIHPCLKCGACCAYFHVAFEAHEIDENNNFPPVPDYLTIEASGGHLAMMGTDIVGRPKCVALKGRVGKHASCGIYNNRPSPCRDFKPSYEDGTPNPRCDDARASHNLAPLAPDDWLSFEKNRDTTPTDFLAIDTPLTESTHRIRNESSLE